ncbi:hypothetical protein P2318_32465 [Myxococcaceae bacterium GXIMD 01537]
MDTKTPLPQTVLRWPLPRVREWLDGLAIGEPVGGEHFNWDGFAFTAASRAREERSLPWAHLALQVYGALTGRASLDDAHSFMLSAMSLRAWMVRELGARDGDAVLDPEPIFEWFRGLATFSVEDAAQWVSRDWVTLPPETLLRLRYVKSALNIVSHLPESAWAQKHPELGDWLGLRSRLP